MLVFMSVIRSYCFVLIFFVFVFRIFYFIDYSFMISIEMYVLENRKDRGNRFLLYGLIDEGEKILLRMRKNKIRIKMFGFLYF